MRRFQKDEDTVTIRVAYLPTALPVFLADGLLQFRKAYGDTCVIISEMTPREQATALADGTIDLALLGEPWPEIKKSFSTEVLHKTTVGLALPQGHGLASRKSLDLTDLRDEVFVSLSEDRFPTRPQMMEKLFSKAGFEPRVLMKANGLSELLGMVASGIGLALVPMEMDRLATSGVVFVPLKRPRHSLHFTAAWREGTCAPFVKVLVGFLTSG
jgi:DNA-binding transcriptional LysR family regulator